MNLLDVIDELGDACDTIAGLRVSRFWPGTVTPPACIIGLPDEQEFETAYGQGAARMTVPIVLIESNVNDRKAVERIAAYAAGSGAKSIKAVVDGYGSYTALDVATVVRVTYDVFPIGAVDHIAAVFEVDVIGPGT